LANDFKPGFTPPSYSTDQGAGISRSTLLLRFGSELHFRVWEFVVFDIAVNAA
jgi:hypothetical protein